MNSSSIYIHYPYCKSKCPYCDFNSHVRDSIDYDMIEEAYLKEIEHYALLVGNRTIKSIYFGGGTPSLMRVATVARILELISKRFVFPPSIEITLEANPTSVEFEKFKELSLCGINRVSLGIQSLDPIALKFLGREHSRDEALRAIEAAQHNFSNYSLDIIYARPSQSLKAWEIELTEFLSYAEYHVSMYMLTIEKGTRFFNDFKSEKFRMPDDDLSLKFYHMTNELAASQGFIQYETSNYGREERYFSAHNLNYWEYGDYIAIGAGAHGRISLCNPLSKIYEKFRSENEYSPERWLESVSENGNSRRLFEKLDKEIELEEEIFMGLRTIKGVRLELVKPRSSFENLLKGKFLAIIGDRAIIPKNKFHLQNSIIKQLLNSGM